ncbi:MAG TPA: non-heme iron oxygenase ferredoxin subunit [Ktedonobacterales bacterium]|nr:non-heme iron oxygenase ferredoxin subunit [Ktedonobacterales bacterium]
MSEYVKVASVSDLAPGQMTLVEVDGELICLANVDGSFYAIADECTHVGGALSDGELEGYVVTCPVHFGQFDIRTGKVLQHPPREDAATYEVKVEGEDVLIARPE